MCKSKPATDTRACAPWRHMSSILRSVFPPPRTTHPTDTTMPRRKNIHWQRLRDTTMSTEERGSFLDVLRNFGTRARIKPAPLEALLTQISGDMEKRRTERG